MSFALTQEQQHALDLCLRGETVFITGQAGTGKSAILRELLGKLNSSMKDAVAITSTTGVSAVQINGRTLHSWAGIGLAKMEKHDLYKKVSKNRDAKRRWMCVNTLVIDEISLLSAELFDKLEYIARMIRRDKRPFGGIQLILTGDFYQLPVIGSQLFCFDAASWASVVKNTVHLTRVMRQTNPVFCKMLEELRVGLCSEETTRVLLERVRPWSAGENHGEIVVEPTRLFSRNEVVGRVNRGRFAELIESGAENYSYQTFLELKKTGGRREEDLHSIGHLLVESRPDSVLAVGAQVILTWNISVDHGLANGSRGVVVRFLDTTGAEEAVGGEKLPVVRFMNGAEHVVRRVVSKYDSEGVVIEVEFMPLILGWACSIHMSQGSTLDYVVTSLSKKEIWEYGQAYVAVSRVKTLEGLFLEEFEPEVFFCDPRVAEFYKGLG